MKTLLIFVMKQLSILFLIFFHPLSFGQKNNTYYEVDSLIERNKSFYAMLALEKLNTTLIKDSIDSEYWLRHAKASINYNKKNDALKSINKAIILNPTNSEYHFEKGIIYNTIGDMEHAEEAVTKAISIDKKGKYYFWRGVIYQQLKLNDKAENDYSDALQLKFERPELYNNYAIILSEKENLDDALILINKSLQLEKNNAQTYSIKAKLHFFQLEIDSSCIYKNIALKMGHEGVFDIPDTICSNTFDKKIEFAAEVLSVNKLYKQGIKAYTILINKKIKEGNYFLNRGFCFFQLGKYDEAEKDYLETLNYSNTNFDLLYDNLSLLYYKRNQFESAINYSTKRIELNAENYTAYLDRGLCYRKLKEYDLAKKDFDRSLAINPSFFRAYGYRSFLYLELKQYDKSKEDINKALQFNSQYGYAYLVLADLKRATGVPDFCDDLRTALEFGEESAVEGLELYCK